MNPATIGFLRGVGIVVLTAVLTYVGDANNLSFLNPVTAGLIASVAAAVEASIQSKTGNALFGAVRA